ncbi:MAG TPA: glycine cleavage system protein GcvH [Sporichthyaceae bacterium]|jgi:glycine cleavage system H protein|nr:glycine cleavage system protein GcvH [Sporichthyaceae bacterium]
MEIPEDRGYTAEHEWALSGSAGTVRVGITDHAQEQLGDIVFVSLPEAGAEVTAGGACGELESTKSVSEIYAPVSGTVVAVNAAIVTAPELVNSDPYDKGWMFEVRPAASADVDSLLSAGEYRALIEH